MLLGPRTGKTARLALNRAALGFGKPSYCLARLHVELDSSFFFGLVGIDRAAATLLSGSKSIIPLIQLGIMP